MHEIKRISSETATAAIERAERYRLLNEPMDAESICRDVLDADPGNERALITLFLALTDQFAARPSQAFQEAKALLEGIGDEYKRTYYHGVMCERKAKAHLARAGMGDRHTAYEWFRRAMESFEQAQSRRPANNDEAILRWNTCARILNRHPELAPETQDQAEHMLE